MGDVSGHFSAVGCVGGKFFTSFCRVKIKNHLNKIVVIILEQSLKESDSSFTSNEVLYSASDEADRSGNERVVNRAKLSWAVQRGLYPRTSPV